MANQSALFNKRPRCIKDENGPLIDWLKFTPYADLAKPTPTFVWWIHWGYIQTTLSSAANWNEHH